MSAGRFINDRYTVILLSDESRKLSEFYCSGQSPDEKYGILRLPERIQSWESDIAPASKVLLDENIGESLKAYQALSMCQLFGAASRCFLFIWVMDDECNIWIAFEEVLPPSGGVISGHPRRRGYPSHPAEEKKLGHPTLINCKKARAAGELYLDEGDNGEPELIWRVNVGSGRYCREIPPTRTQCEAIHQRFRMIIGESVFWDEL
jgi:hypothetical protein